MDPLSKKFSYLEINNTSKLCQILRKYYCKIPQPNIFSSFCHSRELDLILFCRRQKAPFEWCFISDAIFPCKNRTHTPLLHFSRPLHLFTFVASSRYYSILGTFDVFLYCFCNMPSLFT